VSRDAADDAPGRFDGMELMRLPTEAAVERLPPRFNYSPPLPEDFEEIGASPSGLMSKRPAGV
jgi:hypothetical protein